MNEIKRKALEVHDVEQFPNFFSYTGIDIQSDKLVQYEISEYKNQIVGLVSHILQLHAMIGFNNLNYDYPLLHYILENRIPFSSLSNKELLNRLYQKSQDIINSEYSEIKLKDIKIPQVDLYRIYHFDNNAKRTSLKDLEIVMGFDNVEDLPFAYNHIVTKEEIGKILEYNINDVKATLMFYQKSIDVIKLRQELGKQFGLNLINFNDPKIGAEIFAKLICEKDENLSYYDLKNMRTYRNQINLGKCILPFIKFKSPEFNNLLNKIKNTTISKTKGEFKESVVYKGFKYDFGTGGIHGCAKPGIYSSTDELLIKSCDVTSLYANLSIRNKFYPEHLGLDFINIYECIYKMRALAKSTYNAHTEMGIIDSKNKAINEGLKLSLNGAYGKSNSEYSFFYDPKFTMQITINGQLLLVMLAEELADNGFKILMINTDGVECLVPKEKMGIYHTICANWSVLTRLSLEFAQYNKMVIRDVNNYAAQYTNNKIKYKGAFEIEKEFHKDPSNKIVRIALSDYFFKDIPVKDTIQNHTNVLDFGIRFKATQGWYSVVKNIVNDYVVDTKCQKTNRYIVTKDGGTYLKIHEDGRVENIEAGWRVKIINKYNKDIPISDYNLDYKYYIQECNKIINIIEDKQLTLL